MSIIDSINPLGNLSPELVREVFSRNANSSDARTQFIKVFLTRVLEQSVQSMATLGTDDTEQNTGFSSAVPQLYSELLTDKLSSALAETPAFKELAGSSTFNLSGALGRDPASIINLMNGAQQTWLK